MNVLEIIIIIYLINSQYSRHDNVDNIIRYKSPGIHVLDAYINRGNEGVP